MDNFPIFIQESLANLGNDIDSLWNVHTLITGVTVYVLVVWLACIVWIIKDITSRSRNILLQVVAILLVVCFTPLFWLPIYLLIRPKTTLFEQFYEETSLSELMPKINRVCNSCNTINAADAKYCSHCGSNLDIVCIDCKTPLIQWGLYCHGCWASISTFSPAKKKIAKRVKKSRV